jgi:hypothetical protein
VLLVTKERTGSVGVSRQAPRGEIDTDGLGLGGAYNECHISDRTEASVRAYSCGPHALGDERISVDAEEFLAVADPITIGSGTRDRCVDVGLSPSATPSPSCPECWGPIPSPAPARRRHYPHLVVAVATRPLARLGSGRRLGRLGRRFVGDGAGSGAGAGATPGSVSVTPRPGRRSVQTTIWSRVDRVAVQVPSVPCIVVDDGALRLHRDGARQGRQTQAETKGHDDEPLHEYPSHAGSVGWTRTTICGGTRDDGPRCYLCQRVARPPRFAHRDVRSSHRRRHRVMHAGHGATYHESLSIN